MAAANEYSAHVAELEEAVARERATSARLEDAVAAAARREEALRRELEAVRAEAAAGRGALAEELAQLRAMIVGGASTVAPAAAAPVAPLPLASSDGGGRTGSEGGDEGRAGGGEGPAASTSSRTLEVWEAFFSNALKGSESGAEGGGAARSGADGTATSASGARVRGRAPVSQAAAPAAAAHVVQPPLALAALDSDAAAVGALLARGALPTRRALVRFAPGTLYALWRGGSSGGLAGGGAAGARGAPGGPGLLMRTTPLHIAAAVTCDVATLAVLCDAATTADDGGGGSEGEDGGGAGIDTTDEAGNTPVLAAATTAQQRLAAQVAHLEAAASASAQPRGAMDFAASAARVRAIAADVARAVDTTRFLLQSAAATRAENEAGASLASVRAAARASEARLIALAAASSGAGLVAATSALVAGREFLSLLDEYV